MDGISLIIPSPFEGLPVIGVVAGAVLGAIAEVYVDLERRAVLGFAVAGAAGASDAYLDPDDVHSIGRDAVMVDHAADMRGDATRAQIGSLVTIDALNKRTVMTEGGASVGSVAGVEFDVPSFAFSQLEVSPGLFKTNLMIPIAEVISIGADLVIVANAYEGESAPPGISREVNESTTPE